MNNYYSIFIISVGVLILIVLIPIAISMHKNNIGWNRGIPMPPNKLKRK